MKTAFPTVSTEGARYAAGFGDRLGQGTLIFAGVILASGVLALGAVQEWSLCLLECGAAFLFLLWSSYQLIHKQITLKNRSMIPGLALLFVPVLQLAAGRTACAYDTRYELLQWLACGTFFLVASEFSGTPLIRERLATGIAIFGSLYALFAIIQGAIAPPNLLYGVIKTQGTGFGSYTNRNHYAGLMEMLLPFALVFPVSRRVPGALRFLSGFGSLIMLASIFASGSRGGMVSSIVALAVFAWHYWRCQRSSKTLLAIVISCALSVAFVASFSYSGVASRSVMEATDAMRAQIARDSLQLIGRHPVLGSGLGSFTSVYPSVRSFPTNLFVNAAHDDYVQLAVETGLIGVLCVFTFLFIVLRNGLRQLRQARQDWFSSVTLAATVGLTALLVHGFFDFNMQIPANAAVFAFLAGLASASPDSGRTRHVDP